MATEDKPEIPDSRNPLCCAIKQVAHDIRSLLELSAHEDTGTWDSYIEDAKRELEKEHFPTEKAGDGMMYKALVSEIYDHLTLLVMSLRTSQEKYRHLATRDLLTGLYNRNYFNETIVRDIEKAKREDEQLSFIMLDINDFKKINDTFGHLHGDGILKECAAILKKSVRKSDFLCRFGGDEFVIVTPAPECEDNQELIGRIKDNLADWNREFASIGYELSFSLGCAVWRTGLDLMDVMHEADLAMYEDKRKRQG